MSKDVGCRGANLGLIRPIIIILKDRTETWGWERGRERKIE